MSCLNAQRFRMLLTLATLSLTVSPCVWSLEIREVDVQPRGLVYSAARGLLYVSSGDDIVPIDPVTGDVGTRIPVGGAPAKIVISDDGQYIHAVTDSSASVRRVNLAQGVMDLKFDMTPDGPYERKVNENHRQSRWFQEAPWKGENETAMRLRSCQPLSLLSPKAGFGFSAVRHA